MAWEYGTGMGHIAILLPIARALKALGHNVAFAIREQSPAPMLRQQEFSVHQAPVLPFRPQKASNITTHTLADVYCYAGYNDAEALVQLSREWQTLVATLKPDAIISEFAPTLALAVAGTVPIVTVGTGYSVPPALRPLPNIRFWQNELPLPSVMREKELLQTVNRVRDALRLPHMQYFSDLFGGEAQFVCTYPALDCYRAYRTTPAIGPLNEALYRPGIGLYDYRERRAFAYLNADLANLSLIIDGIKQSGVECEAYIRGLPPEKHAAFVDERFTLHTTPQPLHDILPRIGMFIQHGGISSSEMGLRYGVPQLVLANHLEQRCNGSSLVRLGVGKMLVSAQCKEPGAITEAVTEVLDSPIFLKRARDIARQGEMRYTRNPLAQVVDACIHVFNRVVA